MNEPNPKRGEVWTVDFDPTRGAEIQKQRPAVVISSDFIGKLPLKLVVPVTAWNPGFESNIWHVRLNPTLQNGLSKPSSADALQLKSPLAGLQKVTAAHPDWDCRQASAI